MLRAAIVCSVIAANVLAGYLAVASGTDMYTICADDFSGGTSSGCSTVSGGFDLGLFQVAVFTAMTTSVLCLVGYVVRGLRLCLAVAVALAAAFIAVPAASATPSVFNDSGRMQLPVFGR
jgi:hypothetical protein